MGTEYEIHRNEWGGRAMKSFIDAAREHSRGLRSISPTRDMGQARIVVVGCGGAGNNTVKRLMTVGIQGAECIAINTDMEPQI